MILEIISSAIEMAKQSETQIDYIEVGWLTKLNMIKEYNIDMPWVSPFKEMKYNGILIKDSSDSDRFTLKFTFK